MAPKKPSPNRRRSIAVTGQHQPSLVPKGRRRAHSIVPGGNLSPLAKARRSLVPRKSILKATINVLNVEASPFQPTASQPTSFPEGFSTTRSMDMTQDFTELLRDNTSRKSMVGRRVSWAKHTHVCLFDKNKKPNNVTASSSDPPSEDPPVQTISNENDYPGQGNRRRRSSVRYSMAGSENMDLTTTIPARIDSRGSAILEEEFDYDEEDDDEHGDDMDVTEAIHGDFARKHSLSMGGRRPLSQLDTRAEHDNQGDQSRSDIGDDSMQSDGVSEQSEQSILMEYTIPLGQSLRPAQQDEAWLALKQMTHSGDEPSEPEGSDDSGDGNIRGDTQEMGLDDAMARLRRARDSLPSAHSAQVEARQEGQEDSFTSTEDSFEDPEDGYKTMNLSQVIGRVSLGGNSRMSFGYQESMDESEIYGQIIASSSRQSLYPQSRPSDILPKQPTQAPVFQPPPPQGTTSTTSVPPTQTPKPPSVAFSFTPRAPSPSKSNTSESSKPKPKPTFSAAFAPPVTRPSPKKATPSTGSRSSSSPAKRPRPSQNDDAENMDIDKPSPAKRLALAGKWLDAADQTVEDSVSSPAPGPPKAATPKPRPLSPSKKAPFQASTAPASDTTSRPSSALRRPSGYFAKRKSLAVRFSSGTTSHEAPNVDDTANKKKPGHGRASMGSAPADAWTRFNKDAGSGIAKKSIVSKTSAKENEADTCVREAERQAIASPSPTRGSPAPARTISFAEPVAEHRIPSPGPTETPTQTEEDLGPQDLSGNMEVDTDATQQWREGVEQTEYEEEVVYDFDDISHNSRLFDAFPKDQPSISVVQFFAMTGIKFMDELTAPRRSMYPLQQSLRQPRNPADIPLADYVTAMAIDIPQLDLYSRVSKDLEAWMTKSKVVFAQAEEEAAKVTPELFVEYARADEEGQAELLHQLNLIRTHTRFLARSDWYDWKLQWVEGLRITADEAFASLENDARALEAPKKAADELVPALEKEYGELMRELELEQAEVAEIEESDQDYLNELKATIAEQNIEIEALKAELTEGNEQLKWLQERMDDIETQKREAKNTINTAERILRMKQTSTRAEVFRLKGELEALEDLNMCRITKVQSTLFEYVYSSLFQVSIPCGNFVPIVSKVSIARFGSPNTRYKDDYPQLSNFLLASAQRLVASSDQMSVREIVQRLSDYWSSCARMRLQLTLLCVKYPVEISINRDSSAPSFKATAMIMFPSVKGKAFVSFLFSFDTLSQWPMSINSLDCDVDVAYGALDRSAILTAVSTRLSQASPADNYACLLDACIEAQDVYH